MALITPIYQYEDLYKITADGKVYSLVRKRWLKPCKDRRGYWRVWLYKDKMRKEKSLHRLVASSFFGYQEGMTVNHKDNDKNNNHIDNLEWLTNADNMRHAYRNGYKSNLGNKKGRTYTIPKQLLDKIYDEWEQTSLSLRKLAIKYDVSRGTLTQQIRKNYRSKTC